MQRLLSAPIHGVSEPSREKLLALTLEAYDQAEVGAVDGWRHHLELSDLGRVPYLSVAVAVLDGLTQALPRNRPGHVRLGCKLDTASGDSEMRLRPTIECGVRAGQDPRWLTAPTRQCPARAPQAYVLLVTSRTHRSTTAALPSAGGWHIVTG
jgi:hypothetical protein